MSIEDAISGALAAQLVPLRAELRRLTAEVEEVRRALSKTVPRAEEHRAAPVADLGESVESAESSERSWVDGLEENDP